MPTGPGPYVGPRRIIAAGNRRATDSPLVETARLAYSSLIGLARVDCPTFCEVALKDEETGTPIVVQDFQLEWHYLVDEHRYVVIWTFPESGKTQQLAIARIIWLLGNDPRRRYAILSATQGQSKKIIRAIQGHITQNQVVHDVFPWLRRGPLWTDNAIEIDRPQGIKDPSVQAYSPEGGTIQGARLNGLLIDDVLTEINTRTAYQRDKVEDWIRASAFSRLADDAWVAFLTNAWHPKDMAHRLEDQGWAARRYPVLDPDGNPTWPDRWSPERIERARSDTLGPIEFARQMMCQPRDESESRFRREWVETCLERGADVPLVRSLDDLRERCPYIASEVDLTDAIARLGGLPEGFITVTGVDLAVSRSERADLTALFTIGVRATGDRQVLEIQAGRWSGPEIIERIVSTHERFRSVVVVENNAAQDFVVQWVRERAPGMRVRSFTTGRNKLSPEYGVESLAAEMSAGMWIIPSAGGIDPQVGEWIGEMYSYDPRSHTGDRLMASWIAREAARAYVDRMTRRARRGRRGSARVIGGKR